MSAIRHPNVVLFMGLCLDPPCIVTEFCARGSLYDVLKKARSTPAFAQQLDWSRRLSMALDAAKVISLSCPALATCSGLLCPHAFPALALVPCSGMHCPHFLPFPFCPQSSHCPALPLSYPALISFGCPGHPCWSDWPCSPCSCPALLMTSSAQSDRVLRSILRTLWCVLHILLAGVCAVLSCDSSSPF